VTSDLINQVDSAESVAEKRPAILSGIAGLFVVKSPEKLEIALLLRSMDE
jgi:hypothetical protein